MTTFRDFVCRRWPMLPFVEILATKHLDQVPALCGVLLRLLALAGLLSFAFPGRAQTFQWLGHLRGAPDYLPDDWEDPPPPDYEAWNSYAIGVSSSGMVVGNLNVLAGGSKDAAYRWRAGAFTELPLSRAWHVNAAGSLVVGERDTFDVMGGFVATFFERWELDGQGSEAISASNDSDPISLPQGLSTISVYRKASGVWAEVGPFANYRVKGVSADGSTFVGIKYVGNPGTLQRRAAVWRENSETVLPLLPGAGVEMEALAVSGDGSKVVGYADFPETETTEERWVAFLWTEADGVREIADVARGLGVDWDDTWEPEQATGISENGRFIVGDGDRDGEFTEPWILELFPSNDLVVNSSGDRPRAVGAVAGETGFALEGGEAEVTLRSAIEALNAGMGSEIKFAIPTPGVPAVVLGSPLPPVMVAVKIDGTTQPGGGKVEIRGEGMIGHGLDVRGGNSEIRGLIVNGFRADEFTGGAAILISGPGRNTIAGNYLGTDAAGSQMLTNTHGVVVVGSADNRIGGLGAEDRNVIVASTAGVILTQSGADRNQVVGNRIGLFANGAFSPVMQLGVGVSGGNGCQVGGAGGAGNAIAAVTGVQASGSTALDSLRVEGNRIGLNAAGTEATDFGQDNIGIVLYPTEGALFPRVQILSNKVGGHATGIALLGSGCAGAEVRGNEIGPAFDGSGNLPAGVSATSLSYGLRIDGGPGVVVAGNKILGHFWDVLVSGGPQFSVEETGRIRFRNPNDPLELPQGVGAATGVIVEQNEIGLYENRRPAGAEQAVGVSIYGRAAGTTIRDNIVAGHSQFEVRLYNGSGHSMVGNRIGTGDGTDHGSRVGIEARHVEDADIGRSGTGNIVGFNSEAGIRLAEMSKNVRIVGNTIGMSAGSGAPWPNGYGIDIGSRAENIQVLDNVVGGSRIAGIYSLANAVVIENNFIGVTRAGSPRPNTTGIHLDAASAKLDGNTVAHNSSKGIRITGSSLVSIAAGPIFDNGSGGGADGIDYEVPPFEPQVAVTVLRSPETETRPPIVWLGVFSEGGAGPRTVEVYGSQRDSDPQGRVPLMQFVMDGPGSQGVRFDGAETVRLDHLKSFSATVTMNESTSEFSNDGVLHTTLETPPSLSFLESNPGELVLTWAPPALFKLEEASSVDGPWTDAFATVETAEVDGKTAAVATLPPSPREERYFRLNVDWQRFQSR